VASLPASLKPPVGNHGSLLARSTSRSRPSQKSGIEYSNIVEVVDA